MLTEKDYCDYETAFGLIALGYPGSALVLLYSAQKWLREDKQIEVNAAWDNEKSYWFWYINEMTDIDYYNSIVSKSTYNSYEEALLEGIKEAIKILKKDDND